MHFVTFEIVRLRQDELHREAERHRRLAAVRGNRSRHRSSPAALLSAIAAGCRSVAPPGRGGGHTVTAEGGRS